MILFSGIMHRRPKRSIGMTSCSILFDAPRRSLTQGSPICFATYASLFFAQSSPVATEWSPAQSQHSSSVCSMSFEPLARMLQPQQTRVNANKSALSTTDLRTTCNILERALTSKKLSSGVFHCSQVCCRQNS